MRVSDKLFFSGLAVAVAGMFVVGGDKRSWQTRLEDWTYQTGEEQTALAEDGSEERHMYSAYPARLRDGILAEYTIHDAKPFRSEERGFGAEDYVTLSLRQQDLFDAEKERGLNMSASLGDYVLLGVQRVHADGMREIVPQEELSDYQELFEHGHKSSYYVMDRVINPPRDF